MPSAQTGELSVFTPLVSHCQIALEAPMFRSHVVIIIRYVRHSRHPQASALASCDILGIPGPFHLPFLAIWASQCQFPVHDILGIPSPYTCYLCGWRKRTRFALQVWAWVSLGLGPATWPGLGSGFGGLGRQAWRSRHVSNYPNPDGKNT